MNDISIPLKQEILSMNKGYPYTLWNVIYMHKLGCEARGCWRGRKEPLSTGVAFTGQQCNTCFYTASVTHQSSSELTDSIETKEIKHEDADNWILYSYF